MGTTKAAAGSVEAQRAIDLDLNLEVAKAAKNAGVKTYGTSPPQTQSLNIQTSQLLTSLCKIVLISSGGANASSGMAYPQMKGALEDAVKALDFEHTIILRPGLIVGDREDSRPLEFGIQKIAGIFGKVGLKDFWAQDAGVIARAAVKSGLETKEKFVLLGQSDIIRLGRTEWKD